MTWGGRKIGSKNENTLFLQHLIPFWDYNTREQFTKLGKYFTHNSFHFFSFGYGLYYYLNYYFT